MTLHLAPASERPTLALRDVRRRTTDILLARREQLAAQVSSAESHDDDASELLAALQDVESAIRTCDARLYGRRIAGWAQDDAAREHAPGSAPESCARCRSSFPAAS
ncbi:hypothetical protein CWIS_04435 [Cellulomonas sp. A375-1]|uniref:hypothetical protein n=1 Tax=Cellulomonas sp. A375-1 TaxID=1672219 RepID=UPI0006528466|nr:hypothetical protein [Cellulomonas sp. A375-1]KMM46555.1 hypothetical protein CWIS_04435 [Cellulomonas sp. A375-1]